MSIQKEARRDAREYARAQMYYGDGAGTRRKLITNAVASKVERKSGYHEAFQKELARQDMAEHASKATRERRRRDVTESVSKNTKALATGNYQNVQSTLLAIAVAGYFAHKSGLDKKAYEKGQEVYKDVKRRIKRRRTLKSVPFNKENA